ncbi:hypothetical protein AQ490_20740 [Wenjunlia vitaminophila]|uniref:L,D-TPase catalytic domain-containing protein n=1 Tax=Wenjunlia vitaminophila TaxID=76728 RepID=A0A0T6LTP3_WENVI|nr:Ig-like domain-containing protein [Wenjunlia vitaminophila]KRV49414.1 hypothetical protein AQ490_20740 [Wenjunlia vitaminophila]
MEAARGVWRGGGRAVTGGFLLAVTACGPPPDQDSEDQRPPRSPAVVRVVPADGARDVRPLGVLRVEAGPGRLVGVRVIDGRGRAVVGRLSRDQRLWLPRGRLSPATTYTVAVVAVNAEGERTDLRSRFTTAYPEGALVGHFTPEDGSVVGVGMPVSLRFNRPVTQRATVERAIRVSADPAVEIAGHWFGDQRLDYRPREYWLPGTRVTLRLRLAGVEGAPGFYGVQDRTVRFTVGRSQVSTVDVARHTMTVRRDGQVVRVIPISAGSPDHPTYNGRMVISEKSPVTRMNGATVGFGDAYDIPDVPHAMRLTASGTFLHGNYWAAQEVFGRANTSHGCIGLADVKPSRRRAKGVRPAPRDTTSGETPAAWFYRQSMTGDVVEVVNSVDRTVAPDNGLNGWNLDWAGWLRGGAPR